MCRCQCKPAGNAELAAPQDSEFVASHDGSVQRYMLCLPGDFDARQPHDLMIALHGHGSDRRQYVVESRGECKGARDVAAKYGMIYVSPDYRAPAGWMGPAAEADILQIIGDFKKRYKIHKVYLVGGSMGGTGVLTFAALHPDLIDGASSQNPMADLLSYEVNFAEIQTAIKLAFGGRKDETPAEYKKRNPDEYIKRSAAFHPEKFTMPIAITLGGKDKIVPSDSARRLAEDIKKHNPDVLLIDRPKAGHETSYEDTVAALEFVIRP